MAEFEYSGVYLKEDRLLEIDAGRIMVEVRREELKRIALKHGIQAPHPVLQLGFGLVFLAVGIYGASRVVSWFVSGGTMLDAEAWLSTMLVFGLWITFTALRRGFFMTVELERGGKRLSFGREADQEGVAAFVRGLEEAWGIAVERPVV